MGNFIMGWLNDDDDDDDDGPHDDCERVEYGKR
jgi:hypothetical protein